MSTSNFDSGLDSHADLVNKRAGGNPISGEKHTTPGISPYTVVMGEVPDDDETVTISGAGISWTEVTYAPTVSGEYQVDYVRGIITFYSTDTNKVVYFAYTGLGNCVLAEHINDRTYSSIQIQRVIGVDARGPCQRYPSISDRLSKTVGRLEAYADESVQTKIQIAAGRFSTNPAAIYEMGGYSMDFGAGGTHQLAPIPASNYKRIVVVADQGARYKVYAGPPSATATPLPPTLWSYGNEVPICSILVQDNGTGTAGSIKTITDGVITDHRPLVAAPPKGQYRVEAGQAYFGNATSKDVVFASGFIRTVSVVVTPKDFAQVCTVTAKSGSQFTIGTAPAATGNVEWMATGYDY